MDATEIRSRTLHTEYFAIPDKLLQSLEQSEYNNFDVIFIDIYKYICISSST